jgi:hypothetical protein
MTTQAGASTAGHALAVTADNFNRAESDMYFAQSVKAAGGIGTFLHRRELEPIDHQLVIRANRDTLYSAAVFDLDAAPVTITLPDPGKRLMSMIVIDEDQYALRTVYAPGAFTLTKQDVGTRYVLIGLRTFVDPNDPKDVEQVHALQDAVAVDQKNRGALELPSWDPVAQKKVREALIALAATIPDTKGMFGPREKVDPVRHLIGSATGWGGNAPEDATYLTVVPVKNDGKTLHRLTIKGDVPVDAFWSISVYGADGYFHKNDRDAYSINSVTAKRDGDGSVTIQFGACDGKTPNCLPITPGWNYWVRLYRPRPEILHGEWVFPDAQPVS